MSAVSEKDYRHIGSYGLLGDGHGCGLVGRDGRVDWLAVPKLDTPPLLAAVLDSQEGGYLRLAPKADYQTSRRYLPGTMVIETEFQTAAGRIRVTDCLNEGFRGRLPWSELARRVEAVDGPVHISWELRPGTRLSTVRPWVHERNGIPFVLSGDLLAAVLTDGLGQAVPEGGIVRGEAIVEPGRPALLALVVAQDKPLRLPEPAEVHRRLEHTIRQWEHWSSQIGDWGPFQDHVERSALTIKALASADSGALAAAPTTSLPEVVGGSRNFDYRYAWVRDASLMIDALSRLNLSEAVDASLAWLLKAVQSTVPDVHVFYTLDGAAASGDQSEQPLLEGHRRSQPVVVGNQAAVQTQHGSYGDLLGAVKDYVAHGGRLDTETGLTLVKLADKLCDEWRQPDAGLWELTEYRMYTSSLINSWNALDCAVWLAERGELPDIHTERFRESKESIRAFIHEHCWSEAKRAYTFYAGTEDLDAAVLLAAKWGFLTANDPRLGTTVDAIRRELTVEGPLLYRYSGAAEQENAFVACTFWMVEAMCIAGRLEEAGSLLESALGYANDLGLWSEEIDASGHLLGNFPIGISHLAVIGAITTYADLSDKSGSSGRRADQ